MDASSVSSFHLADWSSLWYKFISKRFGSSWPCCYVHKSIGGLSSQQFEMLAYAVIWILVIAVF
jgi:hypothetical protein